MESIADYRQLSCRLSELGNDIVIGVEGFCSSGKTTIANKLGADLSAQVIHTDNFAIAADEPPPYSDAIDIPRLRSAITDSPRERPLVIEGICLRKVLRKVGITPFVVVYTRRVGANGIWYDQCHLEQYESGEPVSEDKIEPHSSDYAYHSTERPHETADIVFTWIENEEV